MSPCLGDIPYCYQMSINGVKKEALCPWSWNVLLFLPQHKHLLMHSFIPTRKKKWEPFPCGRKLDRLRSGSSPDPGLVLCAEVPKGQASRPCPAYQRNRGRSIPQCTQTSFSSFITKTLHSRSHACHAPSIHAPSQLTWKLKERWRSKEKPDRQATCSSIFFPFLSHFVWFVGLEFWSCSSKLMYSWLLWPTVRKKNNGLDQKSGIFSTKSR